jgi:hypothetical protein
MKQVISDSVRQTILTGGMAPEIFSLVLDAFGPLPELGQQELAERLVRAVGAYRIRIISESYPQPVEQAKLHKEIAQAAEHTLRLMGVESPRSLGIDSPYQVITKVNSVASRLVVELHAVAAERRPTSTLGADERFTTLVVLLSDLIEAAERSAQETRRQSPRGSKKHGRGGASRKGPAAKGQLLESIFETYAALRNRYPKSGPGLACDTELRRFARACLELAASSATITGRDGDRYRLGIGPCGDPDLAKHNTDHSIRNAFDRWHGIYATRRCQEDRRRPPASTANPAAQIKTKKGFD